MNSAEAGVTVGDWDWALPELEEWLTVELEPEDRIVLLSPLIQISGLARRRGRRR